MTSAMNFQTSCCGMMTTNPSRSDLSMPATRDTMGMWKKPFSSGLTPYFRPRICLALNSGILAPELEIVSDTQEPFAFHWLRRDGGLDDPATVLIILVVERIRLDASLAEQVVAEFQVVAVRHREHDGRVGFVGEGLQVFDECLRILGDVLLAKRPGDGVEHVIHPHLRGHVSDLGTDAANVLNDSFRVVSGSHDEMTGTDVFHLQRILDSFGDNHVDAFLA